MTARPRAILTWILAALTVPGAAFVLLFGFAAAMGTDRCAYEDCPRMGPPGPVLTLLVFGAPLVSVATIVATARCAQRRWGFAIPLAAFALFGIDVVVLYQSFKP
ncbi:hypothetical protein PT015_06955 [Candidatus Mycobacterium wuenschmannii]|uniref:Transmembrane protein n=1 Tax=Candidatus Mycobacterium wuenschmannii TaxID=3027808 RepID=A0ABY8W1F0_9MYCO|nr:hypothetical protein [Candidatus Mycobacterium wuenschmannii]WIM89186.1 hypothetical protein PT015_06955 [Candidatus Mycobacterium wuenschmannii]